MAEQRISRDEYDNMTLPQYYNSVDEFSAPLLDANDPVHQAGLRLEHIETRVVKCPYAESFAQHGDAARFAEEYIPTIRSWNESIFFNALSSERSVDERRQIIEDYYGSYRAQVAASPHVGHAGDVAGQHRRAGPHQLGENNAAQLLGVKLHQRPGRRHR